MKCPLCHQTLWPWQRSRGTNAHWSCIIRGLSDGWLAIGKPDGYIEALPDDERYDPAMDEEPANPDCIENGGSGCGRVRIGDCIVHGKKGD